MNVIHTGQGSKPRTSRRSARETTALALVLLAGAAVGGVARAQTPNLPVTASAQPPQTAEPPAPGPAPDANAVGVQEVIVTAQRREQRLQDTPIAVTAFSARSLEERAITNLSQVGQFTPSLIIQPTNRGGGGGSSIATFIRGVGTGDYNIPTDPAIGLYVDGVYIARSIGGLLSLPDVERLEVLKGPQGTLYGRNTLGGAISIVTTQPRLTGDVTGVLFGRVGDYGRADVVASVNGPIVEGKVAGKLSVSSFNSDGYGKDVYTGVRLNDEHRLIVRGGLRFELADHLELTVDADYTRQDQHPPVASLQAVFAPPAIVALFNANVAPAVNGALGLPPGSVFDGRFVKPNKYDSSAGSPLQDNFESGGVAATLAWSPSSAFQVKSITAVRGLQANIKVDADGTPYTLIGEQTVARDTQMSEEVDATGKLFDGKLNYVAGVYFFNEVGHTNDNLQVFDGLYQVTRNARFALNTDTFQRLDATSYAVFAQADYEILPRVTLTAGGRVNYDEKKYDSFVLSPQLGTVAIADLKSSPDSTSFTPKVGLNWKATDGVLVYFSYAEGFKSGGISPPLVGVPLQTYAPENLRSFEGGLKSQWFDRRLTANAAIYHSFYDDIQLTGLLTLPSGAVGKPVQNGGDAQIYGYELELVAAPVRGLTFNASASYTHDRFTRITPQVTTSLGARVGERLPDIPDFNANFGAQYVYPSLLGDVTLRADVSRIGKTQLTVGDERSYQGSYTLLNARVAINSKRVPGLELAVEGTNLTDTLYYTYNQVVAAGQFQLLEPGPPARISFTARYKF